MIETVDTSPDITPAGDHKFTVSKPVIKKMTDNNKAYYIFKLEYVHEGVVKEHTEFIMAWQAGPIIVALGGKETEKKGVYTWDRELVNGKSVDATIIHEPDFKDKTKTRAKMTNIREAKTDDSPLPF